MLQPSPIPQSGLGAGVTRLDIVVAIESSGSKSADKLKSPAVFDLSLAYPNFGMLGQGFYLEGVNPYDPNLDTNPATLSRSVLWFEDLGNGRFRQYNTDPVGDSDKYCHSDDHAWSTGRRSVLLYLGTADRCGGTDTRSEFFPALRFMPKVWINGQEWEADGLSQTNYFEAGVWVCQGLNRWHSKIVGLEMGPNGPLVHVQINESQTLERVPGAPESKACPQEFSWQENFYLGQKLPVKNPDGTTVGHAPGVFRSTGGDPQFERVNGHPMWDVRFSGWQQ
jgi:hypothetical protein